MYIRQNAFPLNTEVRQRNTLPYLAFPELDSSAQDSSEFYYIVSGDVEFVRPSYAAIVVKVCLSSFSRCSALVP